MSVPAGRTFVNVYSSYKSAFFDCRLLGLDGSFFQFPGVLLRQRSFASVWPACLLFAICIFAIRRSFIQPLDRLSTMIGSLQGNVFANLSLEETAPDEIQEVVAALNRMIDEVKKLKI